MPQMTNTCIGLTCKGQHRTPSGGQSPNQNFFRDKFTHYVKYRNRNNAPPKSKVRAYFHLGQSPHSAVYRNQNGTHIRGPISEMQRVAQDRAYLHQEKIHILRKVQKSWWCSCDAQAWAPANAADPNLPSYQNQSYNEILNNLMRPHISSKLLICRSWSGNGRSLKPDPGRRALQKPPPKAHP